MYRCGYKRGRVRLKGFDEPVAIFEVEWEAVRV
jgi:class 3 adenylate cyclase